MADKGGRRRARWILYALFGAAAAGSGALFLYLRSGHLDGYSRDRLVDSLAQVLGRPVSVERVRIRYLPLSATLEGLRAEAPYLRVARVEASVSPRALLSGRIVVTDVDVYKPELRWDVDAERFLAERDERREPGRLASRLDLRRLRIHDGELIIGSRRRSVSADLRGLTVQADNGGLLGPSGGIGYKGPWQGSASFEQGRLGLDTLTVEGAAGSVSFEADPEIVRVRRLRITAAGIDVRGEGDLFPGRPARGRFDLAATLDPQAASLDRPLPEFEARRADVRADITITAEGVAVTGGFTLDGLTIDPDRSIEEDGPQEAFTATRAAGTFSVGGGRVEIASDLESFAGGTVRATYTGQRPAGDLDAPSASEISLRVEGLRLSDLLGHYDLIGDDRFAPAATVSGLAGLRWTGGGPAGAAGSATLRFDPAPGDLPVWGEATLTWLGRRVRIESSSLHAAGSSLALSGTLGLAGQPGQVDLEGDLDATDAAPLAAFVERRFAHLFEPAAPGGRPALRPTDLSGSLRTRFHLEGTTASPEVSAAFESRDLRLSLPAPRTGETEPDASGDARVPLTLTLARGELHHGPELFSLRVVRAEGEGLAGSATLVMSPASGEIHSLQAEAERIPAALLARLAGFSEEQLDVQGAARVTASLARPGGAAAAPLAGSISLDSKGVSVGGLRLDRLAAKAVLRGDELDLEEAAIGLLGGTLRGHGRLVLTEDGARGEIPIEAEGIDLAAVRDQIGGPALAGSVRAQGVITLGTVVGVEGTIGGDSIRVAGIDLGRLTGTIRGPADKIRIELRDESGGVAASGELARGRGEAGLTIDARIAARRFSLEEVRPLLPRGSLAGLSGDADATVTVSGPLADPKALAVQAVFDRINLTAGDYPLHNDGPVRLTIQDGFLTVSSARLTGEKTDLTLGGSMVMGGSYEVTALVEGTYDLGLIEVLFPEMRASGPGTASLRVIQRGDRLSYSGTVTLQDGTIAHPSLPLPLENLRGRGRFDEQGRLAIEEIRADMGGGQLSGVGWTLFEGASMPGAHLALTGSGIRAEILPDLRAYFDAEASLEKEGDDYRFAGEVRIIRAIYSRPLGIEASQLLLRGREFGPAPERREGAPTVLLDLAIRADGDLWVRTEGALIEASARLSLRGTLAQPELAGRISALEGGFYRFRDVTYRIVGGSLDFADVTRIDPLLDIEAATRVQQYEVTLRISGRFSKPEYELSSEPPLSQRDLVWLLVTGNTLADSSIEATRGFAEAQVAAYLAAPVAGAVSIPLQKVLGVSSLQIDPFYLNGTADPSARVTVTKRVASNLLFTYSSSLGQSGQEVYQVEYNPGRLWDLIGTRDLDGSVGADVRFRRRWRGWNPHAKDDEGGGPAQDGGEVVPSKLRVGKIQIVTDRLPEEQATLLRRLPFDEGDTLRRGDLLEGREILRQYYVRQGYPAAQVSLVEEEPDPADLSIRNVRYAIRAGLRHDLIISGDVRERPIRKAVEDAWKEPILLEDLVEEARRAALSLMTGKGHYSAKVAAELLAPEPDLRQVRLEVEPGPEVKVREVTIVGNENMPEDRIKRQMLTREDTLINLSGSGRLVDKVLADDVAAIRGLYLANGYLAARVAPPRVDLSPDGREARVTVSVEEGPQSRIGAVAVEGEAPGVTPERLLSATGLSIGQAVSPEAVGQAVDRLREELDRLGYRDSRVSFRLEGEPGQTRVVFSLQPESRARVNSVTVQGNTRTKERIIRREIGIDGGDYLSRSAMLTTQKNLYRLGVFRSVEIKTVPVEGNPELVDVRVEVEEGSPILTAWGVGYDSEDRARGSFELAYNNLFGTRRSAGLFLRGSSVDRRGQITLRDPNTFGERIESLWSFFLERQDFESFDQRRLGAAVQLSRELDDDLTVFGRYRLEDVDLLNLEITEEEAGQQTVRLGSLASSAALDTRDDIISPTRGGLSTVDARLYHHAVGSEADFTRFFASAATFKDIGKRIIWASSVRAGIISSRDIPISERFFAGGDTTLRGFEYNEVGPVDPNTGNPVGGEGIFLFNQELRFPIYGAFKGAVFYDAGNVYADLTDYDITDLRHVLGLGLRLDTPVGPFRVEYGRKMDRERGETPGEFFFSIGQAF